MEGQGRGHSPACNEHAPLSPQSSVTSSGSGGSDAHQDDGPQPVRDSFLDEGSGMRGESVCQCMSLCCAVTVNDRLVGLVVKASASRAGGPGFESR